MRRTIIISVVLVLVLFQSMLAFEEEFLVLDKRTGTDKQGKPEYILVLVKYHGSRDASDYKDFFEHPRTWAVADSRVYDLFLKGETYPAQVFMDFGIRLDAEKPEQLRAEEAFVMEKLEQVRQRKEEEQRKAEEERIKAHEEMEKQIAKETQEKKQEVVQRIKEYHSKILAAAQDNEIDLKDLEELEANTGRLDDDLSSLYSYIDTDAEKEFYAEHKAELDLIIRAGELKKIYTDGSFSMSDNKNKDIQSFFEQATARKSIVVKTRNDWGKRAGMGLALGLIATAYLSFLIAASIAGIKDSDDINSKLAGIIFAIVWPTWIIVCFFILK